MIFFTILGEIGMWKLWCKTGSMAYYNCMHIALCAFYAQP